MPSATVSRAVLDGLLPPGDLWHPAKGESLDLLLDGISDNAEVVRQAMATLSNVRNPLLTPYLDELERDFGIVPNPNLTDAQRRAVLGSRKHRTQLIGSLANIQAKLDQAGLGNGGYGLKVFANDPPINPALFTSQLWASYMGWSTSCCGNSSDYCGGFGGFILANGDELISVGPAYHGAGNTDQGCGMGTACCGYFTLYNYSTIIPSAPPDPDSWPQVFFVAAGVTNNGDGITSVTFAMLPSQLKDAFYEIILRYKPLHTWAACLVYFT